MGLLWHMPLVYFSCVIWREMLERFSSAKVCACVCVCIINFCLHLTLLCKLLCYQPLIIIRETEREESCEIKFEFSSRTTKHSYRLVIASVPGHFSTFNIFPSLPRPPPPSSLPSSPLAVHSISITSWKNRWTSLKITKPIPHGISFALLSSSFGDTFPGEKLPTQW